MPEQVSLTEYLAQSQRSLFSRLFGPDFLQKTAYLTVTASTFNQTYGRKIWDALNNRTVLWNALRKVAWGPTAGWVLRTDRGPGDDGGSPTGIPRVRPVTEEGTLPPIDISNYVGVYSLPKIIAGDFGAPIKSIFVNTLEGGMGDIVAMELQGLERDFVKECNQEILAGGAYIIKDIGGDGTIYAEFNTPIGFNFKVGDQVGVTDLSGGTENDSAETLLISHALAAKVTHNTCSTAHVDGDLMFIKARAGFTSIDDICMEAAASVGGVNGGYLGAVYNVTTRTATTYKAGANVDYNSGVSRDLALNQIDTCIQKCREHGGEPKLIVLGHDQYFKMERLLNAQQRYMGQEEFQVGVGDERTLPGTRTGLILATYMGIPILPDVDCPKSVDTGDVVLGSNVYVLDTDDIELAIAMPTTYIENRDFFALNRLIVRGLVYMMGELRCTNLWTQSKISDLSS